MTKKKVTTKRPAKGRAAAQTAQHAEDLRDFSRHLSEALRIARESDAIGVDTYNALGEAWNTIMNDIAPAHFYDSPEFIACIFEAAIRGEEGGAE